MDSGDGLAHYFIAQHVWNNPAELINHWGKPLFTLLSAPWTTFGYTGFILFNVAVYILTLWISFRIGKHVNFDSLLVSSLPLVLLTSMDYANNLLGGMTEVLFGFLVIASGFLILKKKWYWFAFVVSFAPFSRSEGQFLIPIAIILLVYAKEFRALPFLLIGFTFYACLGYLLSGDFWWYLTQNPYGDASNIYGHGTWSHYFEFWYVHLGVVGLALLILGLVAFFAGIQRKLYSKDKLVLIIYFATIYFGILGVHIYLWANGKSGALGLTRLAIHGWPGLILALYICFETVVKHKSIKNILSIVLIVVSAITIYDYPLIDDQVFPRKAKPDEIAIIEGTQHVQSLSSINAYSKVYYYHPLVAYAVGENIKNGSGQFIQQGFYDFEAVIGKIKPDDFIVWDSHFGPRDMNFPEDKTAHFNTLAIFTPLNQYIHRGNTIAQVKILQGTKVDVSELKKVALVDGVLDLHKDSLYQNLLLLDLRNLPHQSARMLIEVSTSEEIGDDKIFLVIQEAETGQSITIDLDSHQQFDFSLTIKQGKNFKFFFHNPNKKQGSFSVKIERILE